MASHIYYCFSMGIWFFFWMMTWLSYRNLPPTYSLASRPVGNQLQLAASWSPTGRHRTKKSWKYWSCGYQFFLEVTNHNISYSWVKQLYPIGAELISYVALAARPVGSQLATSCSWLPAGRQLVANWSSPHKKNRENIGVVDTNFFLEVTNHNISYSWVKQLHPIAAEQTS